MRARSLRAHGAHVTLSFAILIAAPFGWLGCGSSAPRAEAPIGAIAPRDAAMVPSGLSFHAHLDRPLSTAHTRAGEHFTATLDEPLRAVDGTEVAPKGTQMMGRVLDVDRVGIQRFTLQLDGVWLDGRMHPIDAQILRIQDARVVASDANDPATLQAFVYPVLPRTLPAPQVGGGPPAEAVPLELPRGAQFQLVLTRPFGRTLAGDPATQNRE
jgi:hypothetical protein